MHTPLPANPEPCRAKWPQLSHADTASHPHCMSADPCHLLEQASMLASLAPCYFSIMFVLHVAVCSKMCSFLCLHNIVSPAKIVHSAVERYLGSSSHWLLQTVRPGCSSACLVVVGVHTRSPWVYAWRRASWRGLCPASVSPARCIALSFVDLHVFVQSASRVQILTLLPTSQAHSRCPWARTGRGVRDPALFVKHIDLL